MKSAAPAGSPANVPTRPDAPISSHDHATLWDREEMFWTKGASSARQMTSKDAVFVFPYPVGILQGGALWREKEVAQRWRSIVMIERHICIRDDIAVLAYRVSAERDGGPVYEALCNSTYLKGDGQWLRLAHQQAPVA